MGTALLVQQQHHHPSSFSDRRTSLPKTTHIYNHRIRTYYVLLPCKNVRQPMSYPSLKRIAATTLPFRFNQSKIFRAGAAVDISNSSCSRKDTNITMADKANKKDNPQSVTLNGQKDGEKELEKSTPTPQNIPPPPPPEKPLPDDCCGSGCVRCVWDIYYDELEEYNKLYKTESS